MVWLELLGVFVAVCIALWLRPWRAIAREGPPWPWIAACALLPFVWAADRLVQMPMAQPLSGASLLVLMMGWPLAVLALLPVAVATAWLADMSVAEIITRGFWLGVLPATVALGLGAAVRRWLPHHLFVYILGRGFFGSALAGIVAGVASAWLAPALAGIGRDDLALARGLAAWGDAFLTGMLVSIFVAFRPQWLATYTDRLYLPR